ncbi:MAG: glycosyltransferase [Gemmataceae bacterium]|nr:glycosyltransferase [Gemmataceae bacterium]
MRVSVVINTYNRGPSLRQTLRSLRHQSCAGFEVVVVNGPSTDDTDAVLREFAGAVRVVRCPEVHLSKSRNLGIAHAAGEVVAFLDDDAIPEPDWLDGLLGAYDAPAVGAAGGVVYDHTGLRLQYRYAVCDRTGAPCFDVGPPFDTFTVPGADPFVYLQGTNCSFRRQCLEAVGGFDEEIEYYLDEVEVCMRVLDRGYQVRPLPGAAVHHKYLPSHLRSGARVVLNPYPLVKNRCYFALQSGLRTRPLRQIQKVLAGYANALRGECGQHFAAGRIDAGQRDYFLAQVERGLRDGTERGLGRPRTRCALPPPDPAQFLPYPAVGCEGRQLTLCFLAPGAYPGTDRVPTELAARGHEIHVIAPSPDTSRVDFEDGVWVHRLARPVRHVPALAGLTWRAELFEAAAIYREVDRLHALRPLHAVVAPPASRLALLCALDPRFATVLAGDASASAVPILDDTLARTAAASAGTELDRLAVLCVGQRSRHLRPTADATRVGPEEVSVGLAAVLAGATATSPDEARRAAVALLDPTCFPVDRAGAVLALWPENDEAFVRGLFVALLGREVDPPSLGAYLSHLRRGMPRFEVVRHLAHSPEAAAAGVPVGWLDAVKLATRRAQPGTRGVTAIDRMRVRLTRLAWSFKRCLRSGGSARPSFRRAG